MRAAALAALLLLTACGASSTPPLDGSGDSPSPSVVVGGTPFTLPDGTRCVRFDGGGGQCAFSSSGATP